MKVARNDILKLFSLLERSNTLFLNTVRRQFNPDLASIQISNFTVNTPVENPVECNLINNATSTFRVGTRWKLTGSSGAGKSTI